MITLALAKNCSSTNAIIDRAVRVATFYGFVPFDEAPMAEKAAVSGRIIRIDPKDVRFVRREERRLLSTVRVAALRGLGDRRMPALLWKITPFERGANQCVLELHSLGMGSAAAEALLITVADAIISELGIADRIVRINSIGSGEGAERYLRELTSFLRKNQHELSNSQRERFEMDPLGTFLSISEKVHSSLSRAPSSMDYLNDDERRHFWDVLEYLELAGKAYELSPHVVGSSDCWSHTLFELSAPGKDGEPRVPLALGGRYDALASRSLGPAAATATVGIMFDLKIPAQIKKSKWKPAAYLAHLGLEAKRHSIPVLEILRQADIPVHHSLVYDQLAPQMALVKNLNIPWLLIMGHKEALEKTIAVRNVKTNAQESIPLPDLVAFLNRHHVAV